MSVLKVHYFLWFGSLSGIMPFVAVFATQHSVANTEDIGILYFVLPFIVSIFKPLFCSIADRNNSHKKVLIFSIIATILGYGLLLLIIYVNFGVFSWYMFCILILIANSGQGIVISLNDYLVMKEVTRLNRNYGAYRVWGTVGWGGFGVIAGIVNQYITKLPFLLPGLLMFVGIETIDLIVMYFKLDLKTNESETNSEIVPNIVSDRKPLSVVLKAPFKASWKAVVHVFHIFRNNPSLIQYIVIVLIFGALTAFHWSYYFIYLEKIRGNDSLLMGLALFVESFAGELPLFIVANVILRYCGPSMSLNISLAAFAFRYFIYGYVFTVGTTYWDILLVEVVQGLTFGLFYTVMTDLAQHYATQENHRILAAREAIKEMADKDTEAVDETIAVNSVDDLTSRSYATLQGIMSGAFEGIGLGIGALAGGYLINRIDVFAIWKVGAFLALFAIIFNVSVETIKYIYNKRHVK